MIFAIIPAAGQSTRMGRQKLELRLGDRTALERTILALRQCDVREVLVVLGPHLAGLPPIVEAAGGQALVLSAATPHMRTPIEAGLRRIEGKVHPKAGGAWLLLPADHRALDGDVVGQLIAAYLRQDKCSIAIPTFKGKRGHPTIIDWRHVERLRAFPRNLGLNT